jgi:transcriptional regulator with XRE-family HTH domain
LTAVIRLQVGQLKKFRALYGLTTDTALAAKMGMSRTTVFSVLGGQHTVSARFVAALLAAFDHKLEFGDLFEVTPLHEEKSAPATCEE